VAEVVYLVGRANTGKSALFGRLSGQYVNVSNFPGTTVEVSRAKWKLSSGEVDLVDTPGLGSLLTQTEEEAVTRRLIFSGIPGVVVHVADAKNLEAHLPVTFQLAETGLPVVLAVNMIDEARALGLDIDAGALERALGIPVVLTSGTANIGTGELMKAVEARRLPRMEAGLKYPARAEEAVERVAALLQGGAAMGKRALSMLLLEGDRESLEGLGKTDAVAAAAVLRERTALEHDLRRTPALMFAVFRYRLASQVAREAVRLSRPAKRGIRDRLGDVLAHPFWGTLAAVAVLYFGLYVAVGKIGAGIIVDFLDHGVFVKWINPAVAAAADKWLPWAAARELVAGEYGIVTLGLRYAIALIFPLVTMYFFLFALIEDSGYLPRMAMLLDSGFKRIGLSGRAVIPVVLGFGCDTMATMVTRTLASRRERLIATLLLALAIPCSAQLGVILGVLNGHPGALAVWAFVLTLSFVATGFLGSRIMPGEGAIFFMEVPPMRMPTAENVWWKTWGRVSWYMREILPLFLLVSVLIWAGKTTGALAWTIEAMKTPLSWLGLPPETAPVFLFGFFRRDYGAAGLYDLSAHGALTITQIATSVVALTLFLPCVAQFMMMVREHGMKAALYIAAMVGAVAFGAGFAVSRILPVLGANSW
jgi:ferrous iron transport protein B